MAAKQMQAKKKPNFWEKKMEAYKRYGSADTRPQQNFKNYLLCKRKLNLGFSTREQNNAKAIEGFGIIAKSLPLTPSSFTKPTPFSSKSYVWVDTDDNFTRMMKDVVSSQEISIDLEGNQCHSYHGMTCLLQIGTYNTSYLVDPFPMYDNICNRLKAVLESTKCIKVMCGSANDVIALNRDFQINIAAVIDIQLIQRRLFLIAYECALNGNVQDVLKQDHGEIMKRTISKSNGGFLSKQELQKAHTDLISLEKLIGIHYPSFAAPPKATLADWRIRPLEKEMLKYAVYDVHILLHVWANMKKLIIVQLQPNWILESAIQEGKVLLRKHFVPPTEVSVDVALTKAKIKPVRASMFSLLFNWRANHAKIIDEALDEVISLREINELIRACPKNNGDLIKVVNTNRMIPCESVADWAHVVRQLLDIGQDYWDHMIDLRCHVCRGKYSYPHLAWACVQNYSTKAVAAFMKEEANSAFAKKEDNRRRQNWIKKWGPNRPYPGGPPRD